MEIKNISVNGTEYPLNQFSELVRGTLALAVRWESERIEAESHLRMVEVALNTLNKEIKVLVEKEVPNLNQSYNYDSQKKVNGESK